MKARAIYIGKHTVDQAKPRMFMHFGMTGHYEQTSVNGGWFFPDDAALCKLWVSKKAIKLVSEPSGIAVEIVESEREFGQRVASVQHFRTTKAALAFVDDFNKDTAFGAACYTVARLANRKNP